MKNFSVLHEAIYTYNKTQDSPYDPTKLAYHSILRPEAHLISKCSHTSKNMVSSDYIAHFIGEENIVTYIYFDCGITSYPEALTKVGQTNEERKTISRY